MGFWQIDDQLKPKKGREGRVQSDATRHKIREGVKEYHRIARELRNQMLRDAEHRNAQITDLTK